MYIIFTVPGSLGLAILFWILICLALTMYKGWKIGEDVKGYPKHVFNSMLISPIVYGIYIWSFIQEIILNNTLKVWVKGH
jgi:hypothetical protein